MKRILVLCLCLTLNSLLFFAQPGGDLYIECDPDYDFANQPFGNVDVSVSDEITSAAIHGGNSTVDYKAATMISCINGFRVIVGTTFSAEIEDCSASCPGTVDACGVCDGPGPTTWCQDADGDGLGNPAVSQTACTQPAGYVADCTDTDDNCTPTTWCQDADGDGLGNPAVSQTACTQPTGYVADCTDTDDSGDCLINGMHAAFAEFDAGSYTILLSGSNVVLETDGLPNHTSPYWSDTNPLNIDPVCTTTQNMAPGDIDNFNGSFTLTVPESPALASNSSSTGLGAIGLAVSGSVIYNDEEGPNVPLDNAVGSLDCNGAHTGPQSYHYHLEPVAWSEDDNELIGLISDGFFLYGRKCFSTGTYPTDLDASGGHTSLTQHSCDAEYHYHIENELYLNEYYILFPGDYQGTPNSIQ